MAVDYATLKKGGFMRQKQKNNFSLRLRTVGGHMSAEQLAKVAEVAEKYGEGYVHLTSRGCCSRCMWASSKNRYCLSGCSNLSERLY